METVLNLVWMGVSLGLLGTCGVHVLRGGEDRRRAVAAVALLCLVCLLFPVISATDDINAATPALVEPNKFKRLAASAPAVLTQLPWRAVRLQDESRWAGAELTTFFDPLLSEAFSFKLSRRPPPAQSLSA